MTKTERGEVPSQPENETLSTLVDQVQDQLELAYNLPRGLRISDFLYPHKTSEKFEIRLSGNKPNGLFYSDLDALPQELRLKKYKYPRPDYLSFHPILFYNDKFKQQFAGKTNLANLMGNREAFHILVEEISHFEFDYRQYETDGGVAGYVMAEAVSMIDIYTLYKAACRQKGLKMSVRYNPVVRKSEQSILTDMKERREGWSKVKRLLEEKFASFSPKEQEWYKDEADRRIREAEVYVKSVDIIDGFLRYAMDSESEGKDASLEIGRFYQMSLQKQIEYLRNLYAELGDKRYLLLLEDAVKDEKEFTI
ncbi:MAG: hypothetical protein Q7K55_06670 [Candidatus Levybacteria bacterium]|nr:hypothetical protein [Candidatus Levybacteria bacterium]